MLPIWLLSILFLFDVATVIDRLSIWFVIVVSCADDCEVVVDDDGVLVPQ